MKITIDLDTTVPGDFEAMQRMFARNVTMPLSLLQGVAVPVPVDLAALEKLAEPLKPVVAPPLHEPLAKAKGKTPSPPPKLKTPPPPKSAPKPAPKVSKPVPKAFQKPAQAAKKIVERGKAMTQTAQALGDKVEEPAKLTPSAKAKLAAKARWANHKRAPEQPAKPKPPPPPKAPPKKLAVRPEPKPQDYSKAQEQPLSAFQEVPGGPLAAPPYPDGRELIEGTFTLPKEGADHEREIKQIAEELGGLPDESIADGDEPIEAGK